MRMADPNPKLPTISPTPDVATLDHPAGQALAVALAGVGLTAAGIREVMEYTNLLLRCERGDVTHGTRTPCPGF